MPLQGCRESPTEGIFLLDGSVGHAAADGAETGVVLAVDQTATGLKGAAHNVFCSRSLQWGQTRIVLGILVSPRDIARITRSSGLNLTIPCSNICSAAQEVGPSLPRLIALEGHAGHLVGGLNAGPLLLRPHQLGSLHGLHLSGRELRAVRPASAEARLAALRAVILEGGVDVAVARVSAASVLAGARHEAALRRRAVRGEEVLKLLLLLVEVVGSGLGFAHVRAAQGRKLRLRTLNGARREARRLGGEDASSAGRRRAGSDWQATKANHWLGCKTGQNLRRNRRSAHHGAGGADVVGGRADVAAVSLVLAHGVVRRVAVVHRQVAILLADGLRMILRDFLRDEADLRAGVALVVVAVNVLAVVGLADLLDVLLQALVREEAAAALRGAGSGVAGQRARAGRNVRQELSNLEGIRLLLLELVVEGLKARLTRLLLS